MNISEIEMSDFSLVYLHNNTPHCKKHGAMNKVSKHKDGGGYWRCITTVSRENENCCRAGCLESRMRPVIVR